MRSLSLLIIALSAIFLSCQDNIAPTIKLIVPAEENTYSNDFLLDVAINLWGANDLATLNYAMTNVDLDTTYISGDWMNDSLSVDFIVVSDFLSISNLPAGRYTFRVEATDDVGNFDIESNSFTIVD